MSKEIIRIKPGQTIEIIAEKSKPMVTKIGFSINEVASMQGVHHSTIRRHIKEGLLETTFVSKKESRITQEQFDNYKSKLN